MPLTATAHSVYLSKTKHALVPPKPKELDMTRVTSPSWRLVRMFIPSASSTWSGLELGFGSGPSRGQGSALGV